MGVIVLLEHLILKDLKITLFETQKNKMLFSDFTTRYPKANLNKFSFVADPFGGYIKWKVNNTTIMSDDDPSGETWTANLSNKLKLSLWEDLGLNATVKKSSFPKSLTLTTKIYPIPGVRFNEFANDATKMLTELDIYVSDTKKFTANMRNIFKITSCNI